LTTDQDLVEASLCGDVQAFSVLVERYRYAVFGLCLNYTRDFDVAEDAAQEAFVKAFLKLRDLANPERFAPWLRQVAVNECHMWRRQRTESLSEAMEEKLVAPTGSPEDDLITEETKHKVLAALGGLSPSHQQVLTLFYLEEFSLKKIAAFLALSPQAVNQRLYRARSQLKKEMLVMVEETLGNRKLSEDFSEEVIQSALKRGQQLLEERRWVDAKVEFRKITATIGQHLDAQRGLAFALDGEVDTMLESNGEAIDEKLMQEGLAAHEEAFRLGARDEETVWNLAQFYDLLKRPADRGRILEAYAEQSTDSEKAFRAFEKACWSFRNIDDTKAFELHRKAIELTGISPEEQLTSYFAAPVGIYFRVDRGDLWLAETAELYSQLGAPVRHMHYMYFRDRISLLTKVKDLQGAIRAGREFLELVETTEVDDPTQCRWWISDIWGKLIEIYKQIEDDRGMLAALRDARENLRAYEAEWESAVSQESDEKQREALEQEYRRFNSYAFGNFGASCRKAGLLDDAIECTQRAIQIKEHGNLYLGLAGIYLKKGDRPKALEVLKSLHSSSAHAQWIFFGGARRWFYSDEAFESVQDDPEFVELIKDGVTG